MSNRYAQRKYGFEILISLLAVDASVFAQVDVSSDLGTIRHMPGHLRRFHRTHPNRRAVQKMSLVPQFDFDRWPDVEHDAACRESN
jgi:hypothetical protein